MQVDQDKLNREYAQMERRLPLAAFMMAKMPAAAVVGLRIEQVTEEQTVVSVPGGWRTQNPFGTMYWAIQGMAAELATGIVPTCLSRTLSMKLRMFVVGTEASFTKKAYGRCRFTCQDTWKVREAIQQSLDNDESVDCGLTAVGTDAEGDVVSEWLFRWNFRASEGK